ncbi:hypothetical protein K5549_007836 [Capra hircus]|nr:hypothetical protein K5549_007836 [Capra hircus]
MLCFSRTAWCTDMQNYTSMSEFISLGIPNTGGLEKLIFVLFLMFLFDVFFPSVSSPKMMLYLMGQSLTISYQGGASQLFFYHFLGGTECFLYTVMAYDRFVAICHPFVYTSLTVGSWLGGCLHGSILTFLVFKSPYCGPSEVDNFFCDTPVVLPLACADTSLAQMVSFTNVDFVTLTCLILIRTSYGCIILSIFKIRSSEGRCRALSTCSAHLISIILFYGPVMLVYLWPAFSPWLDSVIRVLNNIVAPFLNPLIYTLRNKDVMLALRKVLTQVVHVLGHKVWWQFLSEIL